MIYATEILFKDYKRKLIICGRLSLSKVLIGFAISLKDQSSVNILLVIKMSVASLLIKCQMCADKVNK